MNSSSPLLFITIDSKGQLMPGLRLIMSPNDFTLETTAFNFSSGEFQVAFFNSVSKELSLGMFLISH